MQVGDIVTFPKSRQSGRIVSVVEPQRQKKGRHATMAIDFTKPIQTNAHESVRILCTDAPGEWPVVGPIGLCRWDASGRAGGSYLENAPEPRFVWLNVYPVPSAALGALCNSRGCCDAVAAPNRLHVLQINLDTGVTLLWPA